METNEKAVKALDALKELIADGDSPTVKPASEEESQNFHHVAELKVGDKLRYKGGASLKFPQKGEEVCVYSVNLPAFRPDSDSARIHRSDFSFVAIYSDGDTAEFPADSRYFERV